MGFLDFAKSAGGGSLIGSVLGAAGSYINGKRSQDTAREQMAMQREFAQNGIRWRVADAKEAGIHPLAALGAQTVSYSPVAVGDDGLGSALQKMGQGITRAAEAKQLAAERMLNAELTKAQIRRQDAETDFIQQQAANARNAVAQTALPPPMSPANAKQSAIPDGGYSNNVHPLLDLARVGRMFVDVINPDIADPISESTYRNAIASVASEWSAAKGYLKPMMEYLTPVERKLYKDGLISFKRFPGGWEIIDTPKARAQKVQKDYSTRHGSDAWHNPSNWKWLDKVGQWVKQIF